MSKLIVPACYKNWQRMLSNDTKVATMEFPLFSDAYSFSDQIVNLECPYTILNPHVTCRDNQVLMRLILRLDDYSPKITKKASMDSIDIPNDGVSVDFYLENAMADQIAVLLSLCLGVRIKAGGSTRIFSTNNDPLGVPVAHSIHANPPAIRLAGNNAVLPSALKNIYERDSIFCLSAVEQCMLSFINLTPAQAEWLIRAAKLYRDALWTVESDPQLSWIMLVSALEVIAKEHIKSDATPSEIFREIEAELADEIVSCGGEELLEKVAQKFVEKKYIKRKYKKFILEFLPPQPPIRPPLNMQIDWSELKLKNNKNPLMEIYDYRSNALHAGKPFPLDMCYMPRLTGIPYDLAEKPLSLFAVIDGKSQKVKNGPMLISVFEYIVRNVLLKWWSSCST